MIEMFWLQLLLLLQLTQTLFEKFELNIPSFDVSTGQQPIYSE